MTNILREEPTVEIYGGVATCLWFIPEDAGVDVKMFRDMAENWWMRNICFTEESKLPGGTIVKVTAIAHPDRNSDEEGRGRELLEAFTECADYVLEAWDPSTPFASYRQLEGIVFNRWVNPFYR